MSNKTKQSNKVSSGKLRRGLKQLADKICACQDTFTVAFNSPSTIEIHLEGGTINITLCEKGGVR
ncbi:MAG: hypothetical protein K2M06_04020 [Muribaculaceae bacterium]|nr:hypothetical protein [Muribaculaceae bacterium]